MSEPEEKFNPFHLKNSNYDTNNFYLFISITFLLLISFGISIYYSMTNNFYIIYTLITGLVIIYLGGVSYTEYQSRYDFIKTTSNGVEFHHSPKFMHLGWLPQKGLVKYGEIDSIRIIQIKTGLDLLEERMKQAQFQPEGFIKKQLSLEITKKDGKILRIGERLPSSGLIQAAIFIESGAKLGNLFSSFANKFPNVANVAKNIFSKVFKN
jgi:hypothetical protein